MNEVKLPLSIVFQQEAQFITRSQHEQFRESYNSTYNDAPKLRRIDVFYEQEWTTAVEEAPVVTAENDEEKQRITIIAWNLKDYFIPIADGRPLHWFQPVFTLPRDSQLIAPLHLYTADLFWSQSEQKVDSNSDRFGEDDPSYESSDNCDLEYCVSVGPT